MTIVSCASRGGVDSESEDDSGYTAADAVTILCSDMLTSSDFVLNPSLLEEAIPSSYSAYREYVPLYEEYRDSYLSAIAKLAETLIKESFDIINAYAAELSQNHQRYIAEDIPLYMDLESLASSSVRDILAQELRNSDELQKFFEPSYKEFSAIKAVYENLSSISIIYDIPEAEPVDVDKIAAIAVKEFFTTLGEVETFLKNRNYDKSSSYAYFWEGGNER